MVLLSGFLTDGSRNQNRIVKSGRISITTVHHYNNINANQLYPNAIAIDMPLYLCYTLHAG